MADPIVYGFPRSTFVNIVRLILTHKDVAYSFQDLEPVMGQCEHLALHPFNRVPILKHDDLIVYETSETALAVAERELAHGQDYLLGSELTITDFFLLPSTFAFSLTEEGKAMYPKYPAFCRWRERMENLPATRKLRAILPPREPILHAR